MIFVLTRVAYRLNTFPLIHVNFIHALFNLLALVPLMERFEAEQGTLLSLAFFFGRRPYLALSSQTARLTNAQQPCPPYRQRYIF